VGFVSKDGVRVSVKGLRSGEKINLNNLTPFFDTDRLS